jgi:hypothetical protein
MIRKAIFTVIFAVTFSAVSYPQNPRFEKLNAYKIGFFTKKLNLTSEEAEKFWPLYNEFQGKKNEIQKERLMINRTTLQNSATMSEKELNEAGDKLIELQFREADLAREYHKKFKEILPPLKVIQLYQAENQYRMQLLNELRQRPAQRNPGPGR